MIFNNSIPVVNTRENYKEIISLGFCQNSNNFHHIKAQEIDFDTCKIIS